MDKRIRLISVVIPMYNEEKNVKNTLEKVSTVLKKTGYRYEIIAVDDKSPDDTLNVLRSIKKPWLKALSHKKNMGPGAGFRTGFKAAKGNIIITMDCDLSFDPAYIPKLLDKIKDADVVIGSQHMKGAKIENVPFLRVIVSKAAYLLDRIMLGVKLPSYSSFFVAYRKDAIKDLEFKSNNFSAQPEILVKLAKQGARIKGVPCVLRWKDKRRKSSIKLFKEVKNRLNLWKTL